MQSNVADRGHSRHTRPISSHSGVMEEEASFVVEALRESGVVVIQRSKMHQKIALIDRKIAWEGSLNILSHRDTGEHMRRIEDVRDFVCAAPNLKPLRLLSAGLLEEPSVQLELQNDFRVMLLVNSTSHLHVPDESFRKLSSMLMESFANPRFTSRGSSSCNFEKRHRIEERRERRLAGKRMLQASNKHCQTMATHIQNQNQSQKYVVSG